MDINYKLSKKEIIRGFRAYSKVLNSSKNFAHNNVKVFIKLDINSPEKVNKSEKLKNSTFVKIGVLVSRKKIPKAYKRNRLKRLIREAYRLNKNILSDLSEDNIQVLIIFSLTDTGYDRFNTYENFKMQILYDDIEYLLKKVKKYINQQSKETENI